jgi:hypothetical protein
LDEIPKPLRRKLKFVLAKNMSEVLAVALSDKKKKTVGIPSILKRTRPAKEKKSKMAAKPPLKRRRERVIPLGV